MKEVLFVGQKPETVDFTDPAIPVGFNAEKIYEGIDIAMNTMKERGWAADACMITPDEAGLKQLLEQLSSRAYDCVVVGAGLRLPPKGLLFFESVVNLIHRAAPTSSISFNLTPQDTAEAAGRRI